MENRVENRYALVLGVSEYGAGLNPLPGSVRDAQEMARVLQDADRGAFQVDLRCEVDRGEMEGEIERFFAGRQAEDVLLLYFSGHGDLGNSISQQQLHLCGRGTTKEGKRLIESSAMSAEFLRRQMGMCKSQRIVVILDCCYSGAIADLLRKGEGDVDFGPLSAPGRVILASSSSSQVSYQAVDGLSLYTHYLIEGMEGAAQKPGQLWIVAHDLHKYAERRFEIEQKGATQPKIIVAKDEGYNVPIVRAPKPDPRVVYRQAVDQLLQEIDRELGWRFAGEIDDPLDRGSLETLRLREGVPEAEAREIEAAVAVPYQVRGEKRREYAKYFELAVQDGYLPSDRSRHRLNEIRQNLGLGEEDAAVIERSISQERNLQPAPVTQSQPIKPPEAKISSLTPPKPVPTPKPKSAVVQPTPTPQRSQPEEPQKQPQWTRRKFLVAGLGGTGWVGTLIIAQLSQNLNNSDGSKSRSSGDSSSTDPLSYLSKTPAKTPSPIKLQPFSFDTATVDEKGKISKSKGQAQHFSEDLGNGVSLKMVAIKGGKFLMGSPQEEKDRKSDEGPQHEVTVPDFYIGKVLLTQSQYNAVMGTNPSNFKGENRPVETVSWLDAVEFCKRLTEKTGRIYRLPSEAEWEYACRAGTTTPFYCGPTITTDLANYDSNYTYGSGPKGQYRQQTTEVATFPANAFGLYDMHGNVWEWCLDHYQDSYSGVPIDGRPLLIPNAKNDALRTFRGGSWYNNPRNCRSANRSRYEPAIRLDDLGFRVVCSSS